METTHSSSRRTASTARRVDAQSGLTLIEIASVLAITAILAATALPSLADFIDARRLNSAASALAADVQFVRSEAVARNRTVRLSIQGDANQSCWIVHTGGAAGCRCGSSGPAVCAGAAEQIRTTVLGPADRVSVQANVVSIVFDPLHGTSTPAGTLRLVDRRGRAVHHIVNIMGRVRSCSPGGAVPGWRAC